jgi:hypothetical protein
LALFGRIGSDQRATLEVALCDRENAMPTPTQRRAGRKRGTSPALGRAELAAEFLKRNRNYKAEHAQMQKHIARGTVASDAAEAAFARRWGLSFRLCAG